MANVNEFIVGIKAAAKAAGIPEGTLKTYIWKKHIKPGKNTLNKYVFTPENIEQIKNINFTIVEKGDN